MSDRCAYTNKTGICGKPRLWHLDTAVDHAFAPPCGNTENLYGYSCDCPKGHPGRRHKSREHNQAWEKEGPVWSSP